MVQQRNGSRAEPISISGAFAAADNSLSVVPYRPAPPSALPHAGRPLHRPEQGPYDATKFGIIPTHSADARALYNDLQQDWRDGCGMAFVEAIAQGLEEAAFTAAMDSFNRAAAQIEQSYPLVQDIGEELLKARAIRMGHSIAATSNSFRQRALRRRP